MAGQGQGQIFFYIRLARARARFFFIYGWPGPGPNFLLHTAGQGRFFFIYGGSASNCKWSGPTLAPFTIYLYRFFNIRFFYIRFFLHTFALPFWTGMPGQFIFTYFHTTSAGIFWGRPQHIKKTSRYDVDRLIRAVHYTQSAQYRSNRKEYLFF